MRKFIIFSFLIFISFIQVSFADSYPYWIEDNSGTYIWTKVNVSANGQKVIYITKVDGYQPNGTSVFEFFDDFEDGVIDTNKWQYPTSLDIVESGGYLRIAPTITNEHAVLSKQTFSSGILEVKAKYGPIDNVFYAGFSPLNYERLYDITTDAFGLNDGEVYSSGGYCINGVVTEFFTPLANTWRKYITGFDGAGNVFFEVDGTRATDTFSPADVHVHISEKDGANYAYVDYIFVRKYADQDPSITIEQISTGMWKVIIYNPNAYNLTGFQVKINGTGIISSKTDSLLITDAVLDFYIATDKTTYAPSQSVNLTLYSAESLINKTAYIDWGDATTDAVVIESTTQSITHTYNTEGTYIIKAVVENSTYYETINVSAEVVETTLNFEPLYSELNISDVKLFISSTVDTIHINTTNNSAKINAMQNKPITIQSDSGYITTISPINGTKTVLIGTADIQYVKLQYSTTDGHNIGIYYNGIEVGYGNPALCTLPTNSYAKIYIDGIQWKEEQFTVSKTRYIPYESITPEVIFTSGDDRTLKIIIKPNVEGFYKFEIESENESENQVIYSELQYLKDNWNTISTNISAGNATYTLKVYRTDGTLIASKGLSPNYPIQTNFGELNSFYKVIALLFLLGVIFLIVMIGRQHAWIGFLGAALMLLIIPINFPVAGKYVPYMIMGLALVSFMMMKYKGEE